MENSRDWDSVSSVSLSICDRIIIFKCLQNYPVGGVQNCIGGGKDSGYVWLFHLTMNV
jgi:hypothetical protein